MSLIKLFGFIHIFFILFCFFSTLENLFTNNIIPQFICSSFEKNITIDFDSTMLNSLNRLVYKHFNETPLSLKLTGDIPFNNKLSNDNKLYENEFLDYLNSTNQTIFNPKENKNNKYFLLNEGKKNINIIEFTYEKMNDPYNILNKKNIISFYSIPIDNFLINNKEEYELKKSIIKFCWNLNDINGTIIKWDFSLDKKILLVLYKEIINGDEIKYKFRYIENLKCNKSKLIINDIELKGNSEINNFAVEKNIILYSKVIDLYKIIILVKNEKGIWEKSFYKKINRTEEPFYYTVNLIIMKKIKTVYHSYITFNKEGVFFKGELIKFLNNCSNYQINNIKTLKVTELNYEKYDVENLDEKEIKKVIKKYIKKSLALINEKNDFFIYQFLSNIYSINNFSNGNFISKNILYSEEKIFSLKGDENLDNLIINYKNGDMKLISFKYKNNNNNINKKEKENLILLTSIPKRLRKRKMLDYYFNKFDNKLLMIILYEKGVLACVDFSKIIEVTGIFGFKVNKKFILILTTSLLSFGIYYFFNRNNYYIEVNNFQNNQEQNNNNDNIHENNITDVFEGYPLY